MELDEKKLPGKALSSAASVELNGALQSKALRRAHASGLTPVTSTAGVEAPGGPVAGVLQHAGDEPEIWLGTCQAVRAGKVLGARQARQVDHAGAGAGLGAEQVNVPGSGCGSVSKTNKCLRSGSPWGSEGMSKLARLRGRNTLTGTRPMEAKEWRFHGLAGWSAAVGLRCR